MEITINNKEFFIAPQYLDMTFRELLEISEQQEQDSRLIEYLKNKYKPHIGLPVEYLAEETNFSESECKNFIKCNFGRKKINHIPFELVSDFIKVHYEK